MAQGTDRPWRSDLPPRRGSPTRLAPPRRRRRARTCGPADCGGRRPRKCLLVEPAHLALVFHLKPAPRFLQHPDGFPLRNRPQRRAVKVRGLIQLFVGLGHLEHLPPPEADQAQVQGRGQGQQPQWGAPGKLVERRLGLVCQGFLLLLLLPAYFWPGRKTASQSGGGGVSCMTRQRSRKTAAGVSPGQTSRARRKCACASPKRPWR